MTTQIAMGILGNTPLWVWGLLALLIWLGSQGLKTRVVGLNRMAVIPVVFLIWGLTGLLSRPFPAFTIAALWLGGFATGLLLGLVTGPRVAGADPDSRRLLLPGSIWPLARNMIVFFAHYALHVAAAIAAAYATQLMQADIVVSGASAGYFIGWWIALRRGYATAPAY